MALTDRCRQGRYCRACTCADIAVLGNAWYAGDVYVGSTSGVNKDDGSKKLATEEYVNNLLGVLVFPSSTADSTKKFKITVDDSGTISATEVTS